MDWQYIWEEADKLQLRDFIENMLFICRSWFHVETEVSAERMDSRIQAIFEEYVLSGGVFGFEREDKYPKTAKGNPGRRKQPKSVGEVKGPSVSGLSGQRAYEGFPS